MLAWLLVVSGFDQSSTSIFHLGSREYLTNSVETLVRSSLYQVDDARKRKELLHFRVNNDGCRDPNFLQPCSACQ